MTYMQFPGLYDYHLHTAVTIDGRMNEAEACERAVSLGIREIAFTNHVMLDQPEYTISPESFVLNPAIDRELTVPALVFDLVLRAHALQIDYGGKGFNVSRALLELGVDSVALDFVGGAAGEVEMGALWYWFHGYV